MQTSFVQSSDNYYVWYAEWKNPKLNETSGIDSISNENQHWFAMEVEQEWLKKNKR